MSPSPYVNDKSFKIIIAAYGNTVENQPVSKSLKTAVKI